MQLDYQIHHVLNNYRTNDGVKYDYVRSEIWVRTWDLAYLLRDKLNININPEETYVAATWQVALNAWKILCDNPLLIGTYGDKFLNEW